MRFDVGERGAFGRSHARDRRNLVEDEIFRFAGRDLQLAAAEAGEIRKAGMGANRDTVPLRQPDGRAQHGRVAGMKPGRDVRRGNRRHQRRVIAERVCPKRLADVGIQIDPHLANACLSRRPRSTRRAYLAP